MPASYAGAIGADLPVTQPIGLMARIKGRGVSVRCWQMQASRRHDDSYRHGVPFVLASRP